MKRRLLLLPAACAALVAWAHEVYPQEKGGGDKAEAKADPAAGKLLAEARAARATWEKFPGFTAGVEVNLDGRVGRGKLRVDPKGKVTLQGLDRDAHDWARTTLGLIADHRLGGGEDKAACVFADGPADNPLGREVRLLDDPYHSRYRIRDRQLLSVSREMKGQRFTITVLKNLMNPKGKYLPASYVVDFWDAKTGELIRSVANHQTWSRVGGFDLPKVTLAVTASREAAGGGALAERSYSARSLTLSHHKLLRRAAPQ
jgi:hypothetical protein